MRGANLMWLLGAGCSVSAGIPTAGDMIWDFKRLLYCSENRLPIQRVPQLTDTRFRDQLNAFCDAKSTFPQPGSEAEYSFYFEETYPDERERRKYIDHSVAGRRPAFGHMALATLVRLEMVSKIWTTNFDRLIEDALVSVLGSTDSFSVAALDNARQAHEALVDGERPLLVKLHGDFLSRKLKNTSGELVNQDAEFRDCLTEELVRSGLVVAGYSGRDESVMQTLEEAISRFGPRAFPAGLFWFHRHGGVAPRVNDLMQRAADAGIEARLLEYHTFDELLRDVLGMVPKVPDEMVAQLAGDRRRLLSVTVPDPGTGWPVIRFNALPVTEFPSVCRRVDCEIGNTKEVRETIQQTKADVIGARRQNGVLCFGADSEVRKAFADRSIRDFDVHPITVHRLERETAELGLLNDAFAKAVRRECPFEAFPSRSGWTLVVDPERLSHPSLSQLKRFDGGIAGPVPDTSARWREAARIRLELRLDRMWLLLEPTTWIDFEEMKGARDDEQKQDPEVSAAIRELIRERAASCFNWRLNNRIDGWVSAIVGPLQSRKLSTFGIGDGIDASFVVLRTTAFSRSIAR